MSKTERKSLIVRLAASRGMIATAAFLSPSLSVSRSSPHSFHHPQPSHSTRLCPFLTPQEREQVARDLLEMKMKRDSEAWRNARENGCKWLMVIA